MRTSSIATLASVALFGLGTGCRDELQVNLVIYDACGQAALAEAQQVEVQVTSPELSAPVGTSWKATDRKGELPELPLVEDALVTVMMRGGLSGAVLGAASSGLYNLTGSAGDVIEVNLFASKVDTFAFTSKVPGDCTDQVSKRQEHTATLLADGRVFIAGGRRVDQNGTTVLSSTEIFDPRTGEFTAGPGANWTRYGHTATLLKDGRVLIAGGRGTLNGGEVTWQAGEIYDPDKNQFSAIVAMARRRAFHTATLLDDGRVLLIGGEEAGVPVAMTEILNPADPERLVFIESKSLLQARSYHAAVKVGPSTVAVIGGRDDYHTLSTVEMVSPDQVLAGPSLLAPRSHLAAERVPGTNAVVVAGGFGSYVSAPDMAEGLDTVEILELKPASLETSTFTCQSLMLTSKRGAPAVAPIPGGVLVIGGVSQPNTVSATADRVEIQNLAQCQATVTATARSMAGPRYRPVATPLSGGDILVTGGAISASGNSMTASGQAEIYTRLR